MSRLPITADASLKGQAVIFRQERLWRRIFAHRRQHWVIRVLQRIEGQRHQLCSQRLRPTPRAGWLLPYRNLFRRLADLRFVPAIRQYLRECPEEMAPLGVWLLGRCGNRCNLHGLAAYAEHPSVQVRRHVARALRRLEAWPQLAAMAKLYRGNDRIQWYATASIIKRPYEERLRNVARLMDHSHAAAAVGPSRMPLWLGELDWLRRPPKSIAYIRQLLARIQRLVHGD